MATLICHFHALSNQSPGQPPNLQVEKAVATAITLIGHRARAIWFKKQQALFHGVCCLLFYGCFCPQAAKRTPERVFCRIRCTRGCRTMASTMPMLPWTRLKGISAAEAAAAAARETSAFPERDVRRML